MLESVLAAVSALALALALGLGCWQHCRWTAGLETALEMHQAPALRILRRVSLCAGLVFTWQGRRTLAETSSSDQGFSDFVWGGT